MTQSVRATCTLLGVAASAFLIWLSTHFNAGQGSYWARIGLFAAAGLVLPLSQLVGGWTKWGAPRFSPLVFLLGFLPALIVGGWVILAGQPDANWFQDHVTSWSGDLHVSRLVRHLRATHLDVIAFGLGVVFGFVFDSAGPRVQGEDDGATRVVAAGGAAPVVAPVEPVPAVPPVPPPAPAEETAVTTVSDQTAETQVADDAAETRVADPTAVTTVSEPAGDTWVTPSGDKTPPA
jgi:hypothetical protein